MKLLQFALLVLASYLIFKAPGWLMNQPIPSSLIIMYMFFSVVTILLVMTSTEESARALFAPIKAMVEDPSKALTRNIVFAVVPLIGGGLAYDQVKPRLEAPVELRATHPAPPSLTIALNFSGSSF